MMLYVFRNHYCHHQDWCCFYSHHITFHMILIILFIFFIIAAININYDLSYLASSIRNLSSWVGSSTHISTTYLSTPMSWTRRTNQRQLATQWIKPWVADQGDLMVWHGRLWFHQWTVATWPPNAVLYPPPFLAECLTKWAPKMLSVIEMLILCRFWSTSWYAYIPSRHLWPSHEHPTIAGSPPSEGSQEAGAANYKSFMLESKVILVSVGRANRLGTGNVLGGSTHLVTKLISYNI